jgi:hypothetical protein
VSPLSRIAFCKTILAQGAYAPRSGRGLAIGTMEPACSAVAILRCRFSPKPVAIGCDEGVKTVERLSQTGKIIERTEPAKHWARGKGAGNRFSALADSSVRFDQMHRFHAGVVRDTRKSIQSSFLLKIDRFNQSGPSQSDQSLRLPHAKTAEPVIKNHVLSRRSSHQKAIHGFHLLLLNKGITLNLTTGLGVREITTSAG